MKLDLNAPLEQLEASSYPPKTYEDFIVRGKFFSDLIHLTYQKLLNDLDLNALSNIVVDDYLLSLDLSIYKYNKGLFKSGIVEVLKVDNNIDLISDSSLFAEYLKIILNPDEGIKFMNPNNFAFTDDMSRIASFDFRILIDDLTGKVTKEELLHIATISSLMLSGKIDIPIGYQMIIDCLEKKGQVTQSYSSSGYLHIQINQRTFLTPKLSSLLNSKSK